MQLQGSAGWLISQRRTSDHEHDLNFYSEAIKKKPAYASYPRNYATISAPWESWMTSHVKLISSTLAAMFCLMPLSAQAQFDEQYQEEPSEQYEEEPSAAKSWYAAVKGGFLMDGEAHVSGDFEGDVDTNSGTMLLLSADSIMAPKLSVGAFLLYAQSGIEGEDASIMTLGGTLKARFAFGTFQLRPGLALGYQTINPDSSAAAADSTGLDVGFGCEASFPINPKLNFVGEVGFITQPAGGNDDVEFTFGPIWYVVGGVEFGGT